MPRRTFLKASNVWSHSTRADLDSQVAFLVHAGRLGLRPGGNWSLCAASVRSDTIPANHKLFFHLHLLDAATGRAIQIPIRLVHHVPVASSTSSSGAFGFETVSGSLFGLTPAALISYTTSLFNYAKEHFVCVHGIRYDLPCVHCGDTRQSSLPTLDPFVTAPPDANVTATAESTTL